MRLARYHHLSVLPRCVNCESTEIATTEKREKIDVELEETIRSSTFGIDLAELLDSVRKSDDFGWTNERAARGKGQRSHRGDRRRSLTNPTDKTTKLSICL